MGFGLLVGVVDVFVGVSDVMVVFPFCNFLVISVPEIKNSKSQ